MTKALDAAAKAMSGLSDERWERLSELGESRFAPDFSGNYDKHYPGKLEYYARASAALRAALPAEPPPEAIEAMAFVDADITGDWEWDNFPERDKAIYRKAALASYRALRAHLLGEDT